MKLTNKFALALGAASLLALGSNQASAAFSSGPYDYKATSLPNTYYNIMIDGQGRHELAGKIVMTAQAPNGGISGLSKFNTVCADINNSIGGGTHEFNLVTFAGEAGLNPAWGTGAGAATAAIYNANFLFQKYSVLGTTDWGALQLAVWDALYNTDATGNVTGTRFQVLDPISTTVNTYLASLPVNGAGPYTGYMLKPTQSWVQELLVPVPEPTTVIAGALLLLPFGASTLRMMRKNRTA
ncbi:MAG TPA: hypothetical protein VL527_14830 [Dongiaceae bacterium]|jgi:hypothetical protein|nr:hypothetical protein [Dongiaceae bacterium]